MTPPASSPSAPTPAWVCAPGVLKVPFLDVFLADYDLRRLPGEDVQSVLGWGMKPTAAAGQRRRVRAELVAVPDADVERVVLPRLGGQIDHEHLASAAALQGLQLFGHEHVRDHA